MSTRELLIFTTNFPFGDGEAFLETEILYLSKSFKRIHILPLFYGKNKKARRLPENVKYSSPFLLFNILTQKHKLLLEGLLNFSPIMKLTADFFQNKAFKKLNHSVNWFSTTCIIRSILKKKNQNKIFSKISSNSILYFYWGDKSSGIIPFLSRKISNPIICRFHNSDLYEEIKDGYIPFRKDLLKNISTSVFISKGGEDYLTNRYPDICFKHQLFRLGVQDHGISHPSTDKVLRIVSCSYLVPIKRVNLIIEAMNLLDLNIEWTHLGGGTLLESLKQESRKLRSNIKPHFQGQVKNKDILKYYLNNPIDLFVNVSESEGIPVSIMEAISVGIPVIATNVGGTSEIINQRFGKLIPKDTTPNQLASEINEFYHKKIIEKDDMRKEARSFWKENFNAEKNYTEFAEFIKQL